MNRSVIIETVRRHLVAPEYIAIVGGMAILAGLFAAIAPGSRQWHGLIGLLIIALGAELMGPEFSRGTLQLVLSRPIRRSTYLISRYAGVLVCLWIAIAAGLAGQAAGTLVARPDQPAWGHMVSSASTLGVAAFLVCALLALFGTFMRSYWNVGLYILLQILFAVMLTTLEQLQPDMPGMIGRLATFLREHPQIALVLSTISDNLFPERPDTFHRSWAILVISNAAVVILLAGLVFRRREVPYGAD